VLEKFPKLRLCLAHYGGNTNLSKKWHDVLLPMLEQYPNFYVDISSSFVEKSFRKYFQKNLVNPKIADKILFGSDWYMTLTRLDSMDYKEFCDTAKEFIEGMGNGKELWFKFTQENPYRFYRLGERIEDIAKAIELKRASKKVSQGEEETPLTANQQPQAQESQSKGEIPARAKFIRELYAGATL